MATQETDHQHSCETQLQVWQKPYSSDFNMPQPQPTATTTTTTNQVQLRGGIVSLPEAVSAAVSFACSMLSADCLHTQLLSLSVISTLSQENLAMMV
jgi:hypothetical protein